MKSTVIITHSYLNKVQALTGGWPHTTLKRLGVTFPLRHGWKEKLIGKKITDILPDDSTSKQFFSF